MSSNPILPKTFAAYVQPLHPRKNYTSGSDGQSGLSADESKRVKADIAISKHLSKAEKAEAVELVDKTREMTVAALKNDGKVDAKECQAMLNLAKHDLPNTPPAKGRATPSLNLSDLNNHKGTTCERSEFFHVAAGTSYAPKNTSLQGGTKDSIGNPLKPHTLENVLANIKKGKTGPDNYVAIAMDSALYQVGKSPLNYGDVFRIPELEAIYKTSPIYFALVDNGGAFKGTDGGKVDICCESSYTPGVNQSLSLHKVLGADGKQVNVGD
ncbi:MAG: hypothetical protein IV090_22055 [Candidatus Sericytochromatia bacterium]|nr:hypothetical protein [Candidatus Sericytochromatia bacterium]